MGLVAAQHPATASHRAGRGGGRGWSRSNGGGEPAGACQLAGPTSSSSPAPPNHGTRSPDSIGARQPFDGSPSIAKCWLHHACGLRTPVPHFPLRSWLRSRPRCDLPQNPISRRHGDFVFCTPSLAYRKIKRRRICHALPVLSAGICLSLCVCHALLSLPQPPHRVTPQSPCIRRTDVHLPPPTCLPFTSSCSTRVALCL